jgi:hypothetical protein
MQAFHEPPSHRPHCSSTQQWVTPEMGLSSTPGQGIQTQAEVTGIQSHTTTRKNALPRISHAHCPQTLIPHMPVPPQESAPSLSPGQSFSCQSPLPWVTRIDWTGSLWVLWQLQGSFQEISPSSVHSLTWRELLTGQQASRSPELGATTNTGKMDTGFPRTSSAVTGCSHGQDFRIGLHAQARSAFPGQTETLPRN